MLGDGGANSGSAPSERFFGAHYWADDGRCGSRGLSRQRCFWRFALVGLGGREPVGEGDGESVQRRLPAHGPSCPAGPGRVKGSGH